MTQDFSAVLCQLTRLQQPFLTTDTSADHNEPRVLHLDLPVLWQLVVMFLELDSVRLACPKLEELDFDNATLKGLCEMPSSMRKLSLSFTAESATLKELFLGQSATALEELNILEDYDNFTDPDTVKELCLNGKLRSLTILYSSDAAGGAFSVDASWQAVPHSLQEVTLYMPLDRGIPKILEQLPNLITLSLWHRGPNLMHLDRPVDPFLDMSQLTKLVLQSGRVPGTVVGGRTCLWTPPALRLLGLAEKRIRQMRRTLPGRSITLIY